MLTLGPDNGSQFTSQHFGKHLSDRGITHRRGGYRDPQSQAFIVLVRTVQQALRSAGRVETIERARHEIGADIEHYHRRPHSGLAYRTPLEVAITWRGHQYLEKLQTLST